MKNWILFLILITTNCFSQYGNSLIQLDTNQKFSEEEVDAILLNDNEFLISYVSREIGTDNKKVIVQKSKKSVIAFEKTIEIIDSNYNWAGNPTMAYDNLTNTVYLVVMFSNYQNNKMITKAALGLYISKDNGETWSEKKNIVIGNNGVDLPDKPVLKVKDNVLHLAYINFRIDTLSILNSSGVVSYIQSTDYGLTWTPSVKVSNRIPNKNSIIKAILSGVDLGEQGPSMIVDSLITISWGSYKENGIYSSISNHKKNIFSEPIKISKSEISTPVTTLNISGLKQYVLAHDAHKLGRIELIINNGKSDKWKRSVYSKNGSMVSGIVDLEGNLNFIFNEEDGKMIRTKYFK